MPTGYTAKIEEGCTFEEYLWGCARAFGALVTMRDEPMNAQIPEKFEPSKYHTEALEKANQELSRLDSLSKEQIAEAIETEHKEVEEANANYKREAERKNKNYKHIREQVEAWEPPSPDHADMKRFMLEQIDICYPVFEYQRDMPQSNPDAWLAEKKQKAARDIEYHANELAKEIERTEGRNKWLTQLRQSVPQPTPQAHGGER